jgi:glycosyltransferase involved in cell wall biosynthesis
MRLLILPQYGYPANHVVVNTVFEELLPALGHDVHMIRPSKSVDRLSVVDAPWGRGRMALFPERPATGRPLVNIAAAAQRRRWVNQALRAFDGMPLDAVLVRNELTDAFPALQAARRRRIPFVFQLSSPDAEFVLRLGRQTRGARGWYLRARATAALAARRRVMRAASAVLAISDAMARSLVDADRLAPSRVFTFPMGVREVAADGPSRDELRTELGAADRPVLVHSGAIDPVRQPEWMLDVVERVRQRVPDVLLLVLTYQDDERLKTFAAEVQRRRLPVTIRAPLHHTQAIAWLRAADVMISPLPPVFEYAISSPTKTLEAMAAALPVVGSAEVAEHEQVFRASGAGIAVPWDVQRFADAIVSLIEQPSLRAEMGRRGRAWVAAHRTYAQLTDQLVTILQSAEPPR